MRVKRKRLFILLQIVVVIFTIGMIALNMFLIKFSEWFMLIPIVGIMVLEILQFRRYKVVGRIIIVSICVFTILIAYVGSFANPYWNSSNFRCCVKQGSYQQVLTYEKASADLKEMMSYLRKCHPLYIHELDAKVIARYEESLKTLQSKSKITAIDLEREIQQIIAPIHDAHTTSYPSYNDNLYLLEAKELIKEGYRINKINGSTLHKILGQAEKYSSYEVKDWISVDFTSYSQLLLYDIAKDVNTYEWINESGETLVRDYTLSDFGTWEEFQQTDEKNDSFVSYTIDQEKSLALLTLKSCRYNNKYKECVRKMFKEVKQYGIKNVAIDLRNNGGGSSLVANELIRYLPIEQYKGGASDWRFGPLIIHFDGLCKNHQINDFIFDGKIFILTNTKSFSSAKDFAMIMIDNHLGTMIGEPPANSCYGYGEVSSFHLQNSGIYVQISTRRWYRADTSNSDLLVRPDIACKSEDVIEKLYEVIKNGL